MSNEELEKYKKEYSLFIEHMLNVHNYHQLFLIHKGTGSARQVRTSLMVMQELCRTLRVYNRAAQLEHIENTKEERKRYKEMRAQAKKRKMPRGRPKGSKSGYKNLNKY